MCCCVLCACVNRFIAGFAFAIIVFIRDLQCCCSCCHYFVALTTLGCTCVSVFALMMYFDENVEPSKDLLNG